VERTPTKEPSPARRLRSDNWVLGAGLFLAIHAVALAMDGEGNFFAIYFLQLLHW